MGIIAISRDWGFTPSIVRITTTDKLATVETTGYLTSQSANLEFINKGAFQWEIGDSALVFASDGSGFFEVSSDFSSLLPESESSDEFLLKADNLSDLTNRNDAFTNLGEGSPSILFIDQTDFIGGFYQLPNPCPVRIVVSSSDPGNTIILPRVDTPPTSFLLTKGPIIQVPSSPASQPINVNTYTGSTIATLVQSSSLFFQLLNLLDPIGGNWFISPDVTTLNLQSGSVSLISSDGSVNISSNDGLVDISVSNSTGVTLQGAYDNGDNADIILSASRPVEFINGTLASNVNSVTTQGTGSNIVSSYRILGWTFIPSVDMTVTALQYDDVWFTDTTPRDTGIYDKNTQVLLASASILKTDPLDGSGNFRTSTLTNSILLTAGTEYVFATVIPAGQGDFINNDAVVSNITVTGYAAGPSSSSPIPLQYPQSFTTLAGALYIGSFEYKSLTIVDEVVINDSTTNPNVIFNISSTTRAVHPFPDMTSAQRLAIASPSAGDIVNDTDKGYFYRYNSSQWTQLITNITLAPYLALTNSGGFPNIGLGNPLKYYYSIQFSVNGIISFPDPTNVNAVRPGYPIFFKNNSSFVATLETSGGINLVVMYPGDFYVFWNDTNTTSDGTWIFENITGYINSNNISGTSAQMYQNNIYVANNAGLVTLTLPTSAVFGSEIRVLGKGAGGWTIAQNVGQFINLGSSQTTVGIGGSLSSTNRYNSLILTCTNANTEWNAYGVQGTITVV